MGKKCSNVLKNLIVVTIVVNALSGYHPTKSQINSIPYLPSEIKFPTATQIEFYGDKWLLLSSPISSEVVDIDTGKTANNLNFEYGKSNSFNFDRGLTTLISRHNILNFGTIFKEASSGKTFFYNSEKSFREEYSAPVFLDDEGSYLCISYVKFETRKETYFDAKVHVYPAGYTKWSFDYRMPFQFNLDKSFILNGWLFCAIGDELVVFDATTGGQKFKIDDVENYMHYSKNDILLYDDCLIDLKTPKLIARIGLNFDYNARLSNDKIHIVDKLTEKKNTRYFLKVFDFDGKMLESKEIYSPFEKPIPPYEQICYLIGIGDNCVCWWEQMTNVYKVLSFDGELLWSYDPPNEEFLYSWAFLFDDKFLAKTHSGIICYDTSKRKVIWIKPVPSMIDFANDNWVYINERSNLKDYPSARVCDVFGKQPPYKISYHSKFDGLSFSAPEGTYFFAPDTKKDSLWPEFYSRSGAIVKDMKMPFENFFANGIIKTGSNFFVYGFSHVSKTVSLLKLNGKKWEKLKELSGYPGGASEHDGYIYFHAIPYLYRFSIAKNSFEYLFETDITNCGLFFFKNNLVLASDGFNKIRIYNDRLEQIYISNHFELLGMNNDKMYLLEGENLVIFNGKEFDRRKAFFEGYFKDNKRKYLIIRDALYDYGSSRDLDKNLIQYLGNFYFAPYYLGGKIVEDRESFYYSRENNRGHNPLVKFSPCVTFTITNPKVDDDELEITITNNSTNTDKALSGKVRIMPFGADGKPPPVQKIESDYSQIRSLGVGKSMRFRIELPKMETVNEKLEPVPTDYFALLIESNGLIDTKGSDLKHYPARYVTPLFDGTPISNEKQQTLSMFVWKK